MNTTIKLCNDYDKIVSTLDQKPRIEFINKMIKKHSKKD